MTPPDLSPHQRALLGHLARPTTLWQIADHLDVPRDIVVADVRTLYGTLGVTQRDGAVARARALGLLADEPRPEDHGSDVGA